MRFAMRLSARVIRFRLRPETPPGVSPRGRSPPPGFGCASHTRRLLNDAESPLALSASSALSVPNPTHLPSGDANISLFIPSI